VIGAEHDKDGTVDAARAALGVGSAGRLPGCAGGE